MYERKLNPKMILSWQLHSIIAIVTTIIVVVETRLIDVRMPGVRPPRDESYLCKAQRLDWDQAEYIVKFEPHANASKVHHMLVYGCSIPGVVKRDTPDYVWDCGEMGSLMSESPEDPSASFEYESGPVCGPSGTHTIVFSWALDAPAIEMPEGVGFQIGGHTSGVSYLVLQVHYGHTHLFRANPHLVDTSGLVFHTRLDGITKLAGIYLMVSMGYVTKGMSRHTMACKHREDKVIHPFRYRTHTHKLGTHVAGYVQKASTQKIHMIGEHNPQEPQMFYHVNADVDNLTIEQGDQLYAYCDYNNTRGTDIMIGATGNDEMCNFYIMYWLDGDELLESQDCLQYNPHDADSNPFYVQPSNNYL